MGGCQGSSAPSSSFDIIESLHKKMLMVGPRAQGVQGDWTREGLATLHRHLASTRSNKPPKRLWLGAAGPSDPCVPTGPGGPCSGRAGGLGALVGTRPDAPGPADS